MTSNFSVLLLLVAVGLFVNRNDADIFTKPVRYLFRNYVFPAVNSAQEEIGNVIKYLEKDGPQGIKDMLKTYVNTDPQDPEELMTAPEIIARWGYPVEVHNITTPEDYVIGVHRIPHGKGQQKDPKRIPVIVYHGILGSSTDWVYNLPDESLGYMLADAGYDVWLANHRGNFYARHNLKMNPDKHQKFWDFTWADIGEVDAPAIIDHILKTTGHSKLHYVGYSMGTTISFVMLTTRPEYNQKIISVHDMGPAADLHNIQAGVQNLLKYHKEVGWLYDMAGPQEFLPKSKNMKETQYCVETPNYCIDKSEVLMNKTRARVYYAQSPAGTTFKSIVHYVQTASQNRFQKFDYGAKKNQELYNQDTPPLFDFKLITAPFYLYWGPHDDLATPKDVKIIASKLPNLKGFYRVPNDMFNHLDFTWAQDANTLLYSTIIEDMKKAESL